MHLDKSPELTVNTGCRVLQWLVATILLFENHILYPALFCPSFFSLSLFTQQPLESLLHVWGGCNYKIWLPPPPPHTPTRKTAERAIEGEMLSKVISILNLPVQWREGNDNLEFGAFTWTL